MTYASPTPVVARLKPSTVSRTATLVFWWCLAALATAGLLLVWPAPYVFRVSQVTFDAWEVQDGKAVLLDHYNTGYARLAAFKRRRNTATLLLALIGASAAHLCVLQCSRRDVSLLAVILAFACALWAVAVADSMLPPVVDPVYGEDGFDILPWWMDTLIPMILEATFALSAAYFLRWLLGNSRFKRPLQSR